MTVRRKTVDRNWDFDGKTITVHISMMFQRRGGRKMIIAPDGHEAWAPATPRPDDTLIRALVRAHRWKRLIEEEMYRSAAELAEAEKISRSFVNRLLRLTLLAPDIVEAILEGRCYGTCGVGIAITMAAMITPVELPHADAERPEPIPHRLGSA